MLGKLLTRRRLAAGVGLLVAVALVVVACGGGGATATPRPPTAAPTVAATATPVPVPTATPVPQPTATPVPRAPGDTSPNGAITKTLDGWTWVANQPNWNVPPQRGGTFNYGFTTRPAGLDPILNRSFTVMTHATVAYNALLRCGPAPLLESASTALCQPFPDLATAWSQSADGLTWTLKLVQNAKWQNIPQDAFAFTDALKPLYGRAFKAADVVHSMNYWLNKLTKPDGKPQGTPASVVLSGVDSVTAVDDFTVAIKTAAVNPLIPFLLSDFQLRVLPPEVFNLDGDYTKHVVGTGAFFLSKFENNGTNSEFTANPLYFRNGGDGKPLPYLDKHTFQVLSESLARSAVQTGKLDLSQSIGVNTQSDANQFAKDCPTCQIAQLFSAQGVFAVGFRTEGANAPFQDPRARLAVAKSIDWKLFINNRYEGAAILAPAANATPLIFDEPPTVDVVIKRIKDAGIPDNQNPYIFDPATAKQLWADSGHKPGEKYTIVYTPLYGGTLSPDFQAIAGLISQNLGIQVEPDPKGDFPSYYTQVGFLGGQPHQQFPGMSLYFNTLFTDNVQSIVNQFTPGRQPNFAEFNDPEITALAQELAKGVPLAREKEISRKVYIAEQKGNNLRRLVLPTNARFVVYNGRVRNAYQQSRGGEAFHQGGNLIELVWVAR